MASEPTLAALGIVAVASCAAFVVVEHLTRPLWRDRSMREPTDGAPYRSTIVCVRVRARAPLTIRMAALVGIALGSIAAPGVTWALLTWRFDGIALSLLPGVVSMAAGWCAGWLLLARRPMAMDLCRFTSLVSRASAVMLPALALLHLCAARLGWSDRASPPYIALALALAAATLAQAIVLHRASALHGPAYARRSASHQAPKIRPSGQPAPSVVSAKADLAPTERHLSIS